MGSGIAKTLNNHRSYKYATKLFRKLTVRSSTAELSDSDNNYESDDSDESDNNYDSYDSDDSGDSDDR